MGGGTEGPDLNFCVPFEGESDDCAVHKEETVLNSGLGFASNAGEVNNVTEVPSAHDAPMDGEEEMKNASLPVEDTGIGRGGADASGILVAENVEVVTGFPNEKDVNSDEGVGVQISVDVENYALSELGGESDNGVLDCQVGKINEDLGEEKHNEIPATGSDPKEKSEGSNDESFGNHADGIGDKIVVTRSEHIQVFDEEVTATSAFSPLVNAENSGECTPMDVDYENATVGLSEENNPFGVQAGHHDCNSHAKKHIDSLEIEADVGYQQSSEQDVGTEEEVGVGGRISCFKDDARNATGSANSEDLSRDGGKVPSVPIGSEEEDTIQEYECKTVENRVSGADNPSTAEHLVYEEEDIMDEESGESLDMKEANLNVKVDHLADVQNPEGLGGQKVPKSAKEDTVKETINEMEEAALRENSYFDQILPEFFPCEEGDEFSIGDLVWGKIKSHPWWPGQIFHYEESSEKALQYCRKDTYLVAFFGDGTFAWCDESQLKPFWKNFSLMSRQSNLNAFLYAIDCGLEEASRRIELGLTCKCLPEEAYNRLKSPEIVNAGVREGVTVSDDVERDFSIASFKPEIFLEFVKELALFSPGERINKSELMFIQSQISAFYSSKGYTELPCFHIYGGFSGDVSGTSPVKDSHESDSIEQPKTDEQITPSSFPDEQTKGQQKTKATSSRKKSLALKESPFHSRKRKSLTELMNADKDVKSSQKKPKISSSGGKKRYSDSGLGLRDHDNDVKSGRSKEKSKSTSSSNGKRKKDVASESEPVYDDCDEKSERTKRRKSISITPSSQKRGRKPKFVSPSSGKKNGTNNSHANSPPSLDKEMNGSATPNGSDQKTQSLVSSAHTDSPVQKSFNIGNRITKIASKLTGPSPLIKSNKDIRNAKVVDGKGSCGNVTPPTSEAKSQGKKRPTKVNISSDELLLLLCASAHDPLYGMEESQPEMVDFFTNFRDSSYEKGSSFKWFRKRVEKMGPKTDGRTSSETETRGNAAQSRSGAKRSSGSKARKGKQPSDEVEYRSAEEEILKNTPKRKAISSPAEESEEKQGRTPPIAKMDTGEDTPAGENGIYSSEDKSGGESSPTALILNFSEGDALPSESDLSRIFSGYGPLEESETEVLRKTSRARVVFRRRQDAEVAFSSAGKYSIFGPSLVSYRLRYLSSTKSRDSPRTAMRGIKDSASAEGNAASPFPREDEIRVSAEART